MAETAINLTFFSTSKWDKEIRWSTTLLTLTSLIWKIYIWVCKVPWKCTNLDDSKWRETAPSDPPVFTSLISIAIKVLSVVAFCPVYNQKEVFMVLFHKLKYNIEHAENNSTGVIGNNSHSHLCHINNSHPQDTSSTVIRLCLLCHSLIRLPATAHGSFAWHR